MCVSCVSCVCVGVGSHMCVCPTSGSSPLTLRAHPFQKTRGAAARIVATGERNFFLRVASASVLPLSTQEPRHPFSHIQYDGRFTSYRVHTKSAFRKNFLNPL